MRPAITFIEELFRGLPEIIGAEIGIGEGEHAVEMLDGIPKLKSLTLVDNNQYGLDAKAKARLVPYQNRVYFYDMNSLQASKLIPDASFDFVYIDADHTYESVKQDVGLWMPKVKKGGVLAGHDYDMPNHKLQFPGVKKAVDEIFGVKPCLHDWWIVKV